MLELNNKVAFVAGAGTVGPGWGNGTAAAVPIGRMGDAWVVANAVLFLASDEARYITAMYPVVDGVLTAARPG